MNELLGDIEVSMDQAACIAQAMMKVAEIGGVHARERELITRFYQSCAAEAGAPDANLTDLSYSAERTRATLDSPEHLQALFKSCYFVAFADGALSRDEQEAIEALGEELGASASDLERWRTEVALSLLAQFKGVTLFKDRVMEIGRGLGLMDPQIVSFLSEA